MEFTRKFIVLLVFLPIISVFSQNYTKYNLPKRGVCAHRGANETHPENTIAAFEEAVRLGAQMIEFDVRMTKDDKLVVIHDASVDRTTNGTGLVKGLKWRKIRKLDAGLWKSREFDGEKVPLLKKVLASLPKNIWLNVHLKGDEKLGRAVTKTILAKNREHQVILACNKESAKGVRKVDQDIRLCNMERKENRQVYIKETTTKNFSAIQLLKKRGDSALANDIRELKKHQVLINYFYSNTPIEGMKLFDMGVDFILTDQLSTMLKAAETSGIPRSLR
ncbi:MAG: hypothetical protein KAJ23_02710 [Maribacter sp.]|nr:hypothetical protein [Maribacter sp.]